MQMYEGKNIVQILLHHLHFDNNIPPKNFQSK